MTWLSSVAASLLSTTITVDNPRFVESVIFYINLGLMLCAVVQLTVLIVLCRKTSCASVVGLAAIMIFVLSMVVYFIQLLMYVYDNANAMYAISLCLCIMYASFIMSCVYSIMLLKNSHKALCIITGIFNLIPPIGVVFTIILSFKLKHDTPMQEYVYNGYAYTYAALGQFCVKNKAALIDMAGEEERENLTKNETKSKLKELKKDLDTPERQYEYATAIAKYKPEKTKHSVKYLKKAAEGGHAAALFNLGYYYELGAYVRKDYKKAKSCYTQSAEEGDDDAALRLGILEIKANNAEAGLALFEDRSENKNDLCARYNLAVCYELGLGTEKDIDKALDIYCDCITNGLYAAQRRIFAIAATDINSPQNGDFFRKVTDRTYPDVFGIMINGLIEIKKRHAADAADYFLAAVKRHDKWEGFARCLVGTLYIDCGKELKDKCNGAEYIKSAMDMMPGAHDMFSVIPASIRREIKAQAKQKQV